jgi:thymidylate kinase
VLVAIEGPDCCGKTTLFNSLLKRGKLPGAHFVPKRAGCDDPQLRSVVDKHCSELWATLYCTDKLYVCDRFHAVSDRVYAAYYMRETEPLWAPVDMLVVYLDVPATELKARAHGTEDVSMDFVRLRGLYSSVLKHFSTACFWEPVVEVVEQHIEGWVECQRAR